VAINSRFMAGLGILLLSQARVSAIPPPQTLPEYESVRSALDRLSPFLGRWSGALEVPTPMGPDRIFPVRDVRRVADVLILVEGAGADTLSVSVIDFDPRSGSYRLFRPGFRDPFDPPGGPVIPLSLGAGNSFQWSRPYTGATGQFVAVRTTVVVTDGRWHETLESVRRDGSAIVSAEYIIDRESLSRQ
jgi:hypothetical protein